MKILLSLSVIILLAVSSGKGSGTPNPSYELDAKGNLKPEYDAAHILLGDSWRMPTHDDPVYINA